jgi:DNA-binding NarL/FixJ family response regulator
LGNDDGNKIRVLIADGHALFREAVTMVLRAEADLEMVGEAWDGVQAVAETERLRPHVVLLEADLPNGGGIRATRAISERAPTSRVIVLTGEEHERVLVAAVEAGASGYLTKSSPLGELIEATRAVAGGETVIPRRMLGALLARLLQARNRQEEAMKRISRLTRREREVLTLLADGADNDAIAQALVISPQTARTHIQNILSKLEVHSRLEAAAVVLRADSDDLVGV